MSKLNFHKIIRVLFHIIFWFGAWLFFLFYYKRYSEINSYTIIASLVNLVVAMTTVYAFNYYLIPKYLLKRKHKKFIAFSIIAIILSIYLQLLLTVFLIIKLLLTERTLFPKMIDVVMLFFNLFFIVFIAISVKFYKRWSEKENEEQRVQKEKVEVELQMLKTQINPHFLFNTLNSIYVLAMKKSALTADTVLKLSDILDYILYKINTPKISLSNEIEIIKNYIELEKIRYTDRVVIDFNINVKSKNIQIPPMLIIPFIENAFKHGVAKSLEKSWIKIDIAEKEKVLNIDVSNSKKNTSTPEKSGGIGLANVKKRLDIFYHESYSLDKQETNNRFDIKLALPITIKM
ncbi:MAG: histidine kinase [Salinivirgaceae bacterium]|nr:histidine kinase [Salinivirgaceae bacterium]